MGAMFDIIGSILVRTAIVLIVLRMNVSLNSMVTETVAHTAIQGTMSTLRSVMSADFEVTGLNAAVPVLTAHVKDTKFCGDIDTSSTNPTGNGLGIADTIRYYLGPKSELSGTTNPDDKKLYRQVNGGVSLVVADGITNLQFTYYDQYGATTTDPSKVKALSIKMTLEDGTPIDDGPDGIKGTSDDRYVSTYWEQSYFPPNLQ